MTASSLPAVYHSSSFLCFLLCWHTPNLTLHLQGDSPALGFYGSLLSLVTRRSLSLPPLFSSVSLQPLGDNLVLTPILWLVRFDAGTAKSCHLDSPPSKTQRFHGEKRDWTLSCAGCKCETRSSVCVWVCTTVWRGKCLSKAWTVGVIVPWKAPWKPITLQLCVNYWFSPFPGSRPSLQNKRPWLCHSPTIF